MFKYILKIVLWWHYWQIINRVNVLKMYFKYFLDFLFVQSIWAGTSIFVQSNFVTYINCIVCNVEGSEI